MTTVTIDRHQLQQQLDTGREVLLLDVRSPAEFDSVHLPGSVNVPLDRLKRQRHDTDQVTGDAHTVVVICQSGGRARDGAEVLRAAGVENVHVLDGGLSGWRSQGGPTTEGAGSTWEMERQVRLVAGSIVLTSVLASTVAPRAKWVAGGIGAGLSIAALTDTCAMGAVLARMPWNRRARSSR